MMGILSFKSVFPVLGWFLLNLSHTNVQHYDRGELILNFSAKSSELTETEKAKFRDMLVIKDSITQITICGYPDMKGRRKKQQKMAMKRAEAVKVYLLQQGFQSGNITIESNTKELSDTDYQKAVVQFSYKPLLKVQSEH